MSEVLAVEGLVQQFEGRYGLADRIARRPRPALRAVDGVDLVLREGETLGLVGESGCGKSTLSRCVVGLYRPTAGVVRLAGEPIAGTPTRAQRRFVQMVFQDPYSSLNPRMTVGQILGELLRYHRIVPRDQVAKRSRELLDLVGLPYRALGQTPRQFSGGQRQRIGIARALALEPKVLIADEPVSALDVSVQANIINLLLDLKQTLGLSMIFVSHNIAVVRQVSDRTAVMYRGRIIETGPTEQVFLEPSHPYTRLLLGSVPRLVTHVAAGGAATAIPAEPVPPAALPTATAEVGGCRYRDRCPVALPACATEPGLRLISDDGEEGHLAACQHVPG
ncbi:ABC transporter ATP-binding protein [Microtetraspora sp. NBRC 13810]|uniref:oligopeptide/dipeptide ABC transporter ATP-binding protein n=1 Tax=Microtetraspora sp. NBRC 13810 TaxID=3030990 RepID=UPI0024A18781|nr:oligopeptide/dipeptide ABC transporter ATP-binding protein [Microtetraspora sp. NBRC 13810]GLW12734.1 ABC transporter ATP-binding protein [Microtetraspora sp. NBRC 13810]